MNVGAEIGVMLKAKDPPGQSLEQVLRAAGDPGSQRRETVSFYPVSHQRGYSLQ